MRRPFAYNGDAMGTFKGFNLAPELVSALHKLGYDNPSPAQATVIPKALEGKSLVCQSETGSGKTHAYLIPLLQKTDFNLPRLQSIIICPSRELARQVYDFASAFSRFFPKFKARLYSSEAEVSQNQQGNSIAPQMIIGTPGRLKALLVDQYSFDLHGVRSVILDEADMLLEMGYFEDIDPLYSILPEKCQTMVFSATMNQGLKNQIEKYIGSQFLFEGGENKSATNVRHHLIDIKHVGVKEALIAFLEARRPYFALVFSSKKADVIEAGSFLRANGYDPVVFTGDLDSRERKASLRRIRSGKVPIVLCSDLLARGIDLEDVSDVVSLDLPSDLSYYYHRAGRTARFGKDGDSWVFYNADSLSKPKELLSQGVAFDFYSLKNGALSQDAVGLAEKKKYTKKKPFSDEEIKEIKKAKAMASSSQVKPGYKKKKKQAIAKVKNKFRRKAIQKSIQKKKDERYAKRAKAKLAGDE